MQVTDLRSSIAADQRQMIHFGDEKLSLACIAVDLVDLHMQQLDKDLVLLQAEAEVRQKCRFLIKPDIIDEPMLHFL